MPNASTMDKQRLIEGPSPFIVKVQNFNFIAPARPTLKFTQIAIWHHFYVYKYQTSWINCKGCFKCDRKWFDWVNCSDS